MSSLRGGEEPLKVNMTEKRRRGSELPWWVWVGFAVLFVFCVPWYLSCASIKGPGIWAFPLWGAIIVGFSFLLAGYTAFVYLRVWRTPDEGRNAARTRRKRRGT